MGEVLLKYQQVVDSWEYEEEGGYRYFMYPTEIFDYFGIDLDEKILLIWVVGPDNDMYIKLVWGHELAGGIEE